MYDLATLGDAPDLSFAALSARCELRPIRCQDQLVKARAVLAELEAIDRAYKSYDAFEYAEVLQALVDRYVAEELEKFRRVGADDADVLAFLVGLHGYGVGPDAIDAMTRLGEAMGAPPTNLLAVLRRRRCLSRDEVAKLAVFFEVDAAVFSRRPVLRIRRRSRFVVGGRNGGPRSLIDQQTNATYVLGDDDGPTLVDDAGVAWRIPRTALFHDDEFEAQCNDDVDATLRRYFPASQ